MQRINEDNFLIPIPLMQRVINIAGPSRHANLGEAELLQGQRMPDRSIEAGNPLPPRPASLRTSEHDTGSLRRAALPSTNLQPAALPPLTRTADAVEATKRTLRNVAVKANLYPEYPPLTELYATVTREKISRQALINRIHELAMGPNAAAFDTHQPDIHGVTIRLHPSLPDDHVLHVLLRYETAAGGALRDMRLAPSNHGEVLAELLRQMAKTGERSTAHLMSKRTSAAVNRHFQALWWVRKEEFTDIHKALKTIPQYARLTGPKSLAVLHEMANEAPAFPTRVPNVQEIAIAVPLPEERILQFRFLRRIDEHGQLADIHLRPDNENEKEVLLNQMARGADVSATVSDPVRERDYQPTVIRRCRQIWKEVAADFEDEYAAYRDLPGKSKTTGAMFVKYLDTLCTHTEGQPVDVDGKAITHHVLDADGWSEPVAVFRYHDPRGLGAMRKVCLDGTDGQEVLQALLKDIEKLRPFTADAATLDAAPAPKKKVIHLRRGLKNAVLLKQALEAMMQNKERGMRLFEGIEEATRIPARTLAAWVSADGSLRGTPTELLRLTGYFAVREELARLFQALGQHESAQRLPPPVTTGMLVEALTGLRNNLSASADDLAALVKTSARVIRQLVDVETGELLLSDAELCRLPDYETLRDELRTCLAALRRPRANALPSPMPPAGSARFGVWGGQGERGKRSKRLKLAHAQENRTDANLRADLHFGLVPRVPRTTRVLTADVKPEPVIAVLRSPQRGAVTYVETPLDQARTAFYRQLGALCDLTGEKAQWSAHFDRNDAVIVRHGMTPVLENDHKFPLRDPADPLSRAHWRYAGGDGKCHPNVRLTNVRLSSGFRSYLRHLAKSDERLRLDPRDIQQIVTRLEIDAARELERLIREEPAPPRCQPRKLLPDDVQPHERALIGQHGLFVSRPQAPAERPTLSNGRILGFYMGALVENDGDIAQTRAAHPNFEHYAIGAYPGRGQVMYSALGAANSIAFANTAL